MLSTHDTCSQVTETAAHRRYKDETKFIAHLETHMWTPHLQDTCETETQDNKLATIMRKSNCFHRMQ